MANIKTRSTRSATDPGTQTSAKGSALTHSEMDSNFLLLNDKKLEITGPQTFTGDLTLTSSTSSAVGSIQLLEAADNGTSKITLKAPTALASDVTFQLPNSNGTNGYGLVTDGNGVLSWAETAGDITEIVAGTGLTGSSLTSGAATLNVIGGTGIDANANDISIDSTVATLAGSQTFTNKTIDANGTGNNITNIDIGNMTAAVVVLESEGIGSNDNDTTLPTSAAVKDYVDTQVATKDNTDEITEGSSNLYFTNARADARIAAASINALSDVNTSGVSNGQVLAYNSTSGNFEPAADSTLSLIDEDNFSSDSATRPPSQQSVKAYIATQIATKDNSDEIAEGSTNLYFTNARADARIAAADTDSLSEGSSNLYHTTARARAAISASGSLAYNSSTGALTYTQAAIDADSTTVSNLEVDNFKAATIVLESEGIGSNDNDTTIPTSAAVKDYVDNNAGGSSTLAGLTDTTISSVGDNEVLAYDNSSSKFINQTPSEAGIMDLTTSQTKAGDTFFSDNVEFQDNIKVVDNKYLEFGTESDAYMRYNNSSNRFEFEVRDYGTSASGKGDLRIRVDNRIDLIAGRDEDSKGDLILTSYDDFQFKKGPQVTKLSDVTATGSSGSNTVTLSTDLTTAEQTLVNAEEGVFYHSSGTGGEYVFITAFNNNGSSTTITLDDNLSATISGVTAELYRKGRNTKVIVDTSSRTTSSTGRFVLQNRLGTEKPQANQLTFESVEFNDGAEPFSNDPGNSTENESRPVRYDLYTTADKNTFTFEHSRQNLGSYNSGTTIFKAKGRSSETSTVASPTSPDMIEFGVDIDATKNIVLHNQSGDPSGVADASHIYAKDESSSSEVFVRDEAGNVTKISPHNQQGEWEYYSRNIKTGKTVRVNMEKMIQDIERLTGNKYIENE